MPIGVRRGTPADTAVVAEFNRLLASESEGKTLDVEVLRRGVTAILNDPAKGLYFLAEENGKVVGQAAVTYEWSDWRNGWVWWLQSVYVDATARRRGVFRTLFEHICQAARDAGDVIGLRLYVERDNHHAQETYRQMGMQPMPFLLLERRPL